MGFALISKAPTASQGNKIKASNLLKGKSTSVINKGCHCLSVFQTQAEWINDLLHWGSTALLTVSFLIICGSGWTEMQLFLLHPFFCPSFIFPPFVYVCILFLIIFYFFLRFSINSIFSCLSSHSNTDGLWNQLTDFKCFVLLSKSMRSFFWGLYHVYFLSPSSTYTLGSFYNNSLQSFPCLCIYSCIHPTTFWDPITCRACSRHCEYGNEQNKQIVTFLGIPKWPQKSYSVSKNPGGNMSAGVFLPLS